MAAFHLIIYGRFWVITEADAFRKMELFNPDDSWIPVPEQGGSETSE